MARGGRGRARAPKQAARKTPPPRRAPWFVTGALIGAVASAAVFVAGLVPESWQTAVREAALGAGGAAPVATETAARREPRPKPRFEFYTMLPEMEVAVPEEELQAQTAAEARAPEAAAPAATREPRAATAPATPRAPAADAYILQVGSFRRADEAEKLKANLAFLGLEASVQTVAIDGADTWHRVRVGPYRKLETLNEARARLRENGMRSMVLRIKQ